MIFQNIQKVATKVIGLELSASAKLAVIWITEST